MNNWSTDRMTLHVALGDVDNKVIEQFIGGKEGSSYTRITDPQLFDATYYVVANDYGLDRESIVTTLLLLADYTEESDMSWLTEKDGRYVNIDGLECAYTVHEGIVKFLAIDVYVTYLQAME